jgi:hypothetical protein
MPHWANWTILTTLTMVAILGCHLTNAAEPAQTSAQRSAELRRVIDKITDPDPFQRVANLEEIVRGGDAVSIQIALKTAFASKDPELRTVALRSYLATVTNLQFDIRDPAEGSEPSKPGAAQKPASKPDQQIEKLRTVLSRKFLLQIQEVDLKTGKFTVYPMNGQVRPRDDTRAEGQVVGTRVRTVLNVYGAGQCAIEVSPTSELMLEGTASCRGYPDARISTEMF